MIASRILLFTGLACLAVAASAAEIRVAGSDLLGDSFTRAVAEFARQNGVTVELDLRGTRPGKDDLVAGRADLGLLLLPPGEPPPGAALVSCVLAYQVAVVVVPVASPLKQLTVAQLHGLFVRSAGDTFSRWGEFNLIGEWASRPVTLQALAPGAGPAWPLFQRVILAGGEAKAPLVFWPTPEIFDRQLAVAANAIGITTGPAAGAGLRVLSVASSPTEPAYAPTPENVHHGGYLLRMPLYLSFHREAAPRLQRFLKFLLSDEGAAALATAHFVPLPPGARNQLVFELEEMR